MSRTARLVTLAAIITISMGVIVLHSVTHRSSSLSSSEFVTDPTTSVAGIPVLGTHRHPDESCASTPAPVDVGKPKINSLDRLDLLESNVPNNPERIVVLSEEDLDGLCALGLQSKIIGASHEENTSHQVAYLGRNIFDLPVVGIGNQIDYEAIRVIHPDVIFAPQRLGNDLLIQLAKVAPTVVTDRPHEGWQDNFLRISQAVHRGQAGQELLNQFHRRIHEASQADDASHFQVSIVQIDAHSIRIYGEDDFSSQILHQLGVSRPSSQQFVDKPYHDITFIPHHDVDLSNADGDVVYVSFGDQQAKDTAENILDSSSWRHLSARANNQIFIVNNEIWHLGRGLIAAQGILDDLHYLNTPLN